MKIEVQWHKRASPSHLEFQGITASGLKTEIGARANLEDPQTAPSPKELVAFGMASCTGVDVVSTLQKMRQPLADFSVNCEIEQTETHPRVFKTCLMTYKVFGEGLDTARVAHAVGLSLHKYCGVSAMIERSGCELTSRLFVNSVEVPIETKSGSELP